jgi:hypothetical protein
VITVSSGGMYTQHLDPATLQLPASRYSGVTAYARAKRAQVALSREWGSSRGRPGAGERRLRRRGTGAAVHRASSQDLPGHVQHPRHPGDVGDDGGPASAHTQQFLEQF